MKFSLLGHLVIVYNFWRELASVDSIMVDGHLFCFFDTLFKVGINCILRDVRYVMPFFGLVLQFFVNFPVICVNQSADYQTTAENIL